MSDWPVFMDLGRTSAGEYGLYDESDHYREDFGYVHVDAARAWQALRDWLNATKEYEA